MQTETRRHPNYLGVFIALVVITGIEVLISYTLAIGVLQAPLLVMLSLFKAMLVVAYYMHLKFDNRWYILILGYAVAFGIALSVTFMLE